MTRQPCASEVLTSTPHSGASLALPQFRYYSIALLLSVPTMANQCSSTDEKKPQECFDGPALASKGLVRRRTHTHHLFVSPSKNS